MDPQAPVDPGTFYGQLLFALGAGAGPTLAISPEVIAYVQNWVSDREDALTMPRCRALLMAAPAAAAAALRATPGGVFSLEAIKRAEAELVRSDSALCDPPDPPPPPPLPPDA